MKRSLDGLLQFATVSYERTEVVGEVVRARVDHPARRPDRCRLLLLVLLLGSAPGLGCGAASNARGQDATSGVADAAAGTAGDVTPRDVGTTDGTIADSARSDVATSDALQIPVAIPGLAVWLDGDQGVTAPGGALATWLDRSPQRHTFLAQSPGSADELPKFALLDGHGAIRFDGHNRIVSERAPSAPQAESLTLGGDGFLVAMVFELDEAPAIPEVLLALSGPWFDPLSPGIPPPSNLAPMFVTIEQTGLSALIAGRTFFFVESVDFTAPHLLVLAVTDDRISIQLDGRAAQDQICAPAPCVRAGLAYAPLYAGNWDFDIAGLGGSLSELILARGAPLTGTVARLEAYLLRKYSLP